MGIGREKREELFEQPSFNPVMDFNEIGSLLDQLVPTKKKSPISDRLVEKVDRYFEEKERNKK
jgi:hypothetical protein